MQGTDQLHNVNLDKSKSLNVARCETESGKKNLLRQIVEYSTHCINYAKREQEKHVLFKLL